MTTSRRSASPKAPSTFTFANWMTTSPSKWTRRIWHSRCCGTGDYRSWLNENGDATIITVRDGEGEVTGGGQAFAVHAGQSASVTGTDQLDAELDDAYPDDDFDNWCLERIAARTMCRDMSRRKWSATTN